MSREFDADVSEEDTSTEVEPGAVSGDEEVEQNEDIWLRADATPVSKSCSNERLQYNGFFHIVWSTNSHTVFYSCLTDTYMSQCSILMDIGPVLL